MKSVFLNFIAAIIFILILFIEVDIDNYLKIIATPILAVIISGFIYRLSAIFIFIILVILCPIMVLETLFLITGTTHPGNAAQYMMENIPAEIYIMLFLVPIVGVLAQALLLGLSARSSLFSWPIAFVFKKVRLDK